MCGERGQWQQEVAAVELAACRGWADGAQLSAFTLEVPPSPDKVLNSSRVQVAICSGYLAGLPKLGCSMGPQGIGNQDTSKILSDRCRSSSGWPVPCEHSIPVPELTGSSQYLRRHKDSYLRPREAGDGGV